MILLTKLDNSSILLNIELVKFIESVPDTLITFLNGDSVIVRESINKIEELLIELKAKIISQANKNEKINK